MITCLKCGAANPGGFSSCRVCGFAIGDGNATSAGYAAFSGAIPWEHIDAYGVVKAFVRTTAIVFFKPIQFFKALRRSKDSYAAWLFALIAGSLGYLINYLWAHLLRVDTFQTLQTIAVDWGVESSATTLVTAPVMVSLNIIVLSAYCHGLLALFGLKKYAFAATFRIICYSKAAVLWHIVPIVGGFVSVIWTLYLVISGIAYMHGVGRIRVLILLLAPIIILSLFASLLVIAVIGAGLFSSGLLRGLLEIIR
jgi:hypothetical protein